MKKRLSIAGVLLPMLLIGILWAVRAHGRAQQCLNNMRQLDGAAVSYCLEQRLSPTSVLSVAILSPYLKPGIMCPAGQYEYPPFSVLNGPVCPNGHPYLQGLTRPLRAPANN